MHCFGCGSSPAISKCKWAPNLHPDESRYFSKILVITLSFGLSLCRHCSQHSWSFCNFTFFEQLSRYVPLFRLHFFEHSCRISCSAPKSNTQAVITIEHLFWKILYRLNHKSSNNQPSPSEAHVFLGSLPSYFCFHSLDFVPSSISVEPIRWSFGSKVSWSFSQVISTIADCSWSFAYLSSMTSSHYPNYSP